MGRVNSLFHLTIRDMSWFVQICCSSLLDCLQIFLSLLLADLLSILIDPCSQVGRRCKFGPFYRAFRELDDIVAMDVAVVCSADHEQLDDAPNLLDDLHCIGVVCVYLFC